MTIYRLLREASFGPKVVTIMSTAYKLAVKQLRLSRTNPLIREIAKKAIDGVRTGQDIPATDG